MNKLIITVACLIALASNVNAACRTYHDRYYSGPTTICSELIGPTPRAIKQYRCTRTWPPKCEWISRY